MAGLFEDRMCLYSFVSVIHFIGRSFLNLCSFTSVVKRYVCGSCRIDMEGTIRSNRLELGVLDNPLLVCDFIGSSPTLNHVQY